MEKEILEKEIRKVFGSGSSLIVKANPQHYFELIQALILNEIPEPEEGSPRGLILFSHDQAARDFESFIQAAFKKHDLTLDLIVEKGQRIKQRNDLYYGTELIIGTPKRLCELYYQNGFNIGQLRFFMILDINLSLIHI